MYAGFWLRVAAHLSDWTLLALLDVVVYEAVVSLSLQLTGWPPLPGQLLAAIIIANLLYYTGFTASPLQATPGKYLLGLRVTGPDLGHPGVLRALVRSVAGGLCWLTLGAGFALSAITPARRALHDLVAGTRVLRRARVEPTRRRGVDPARVAADRAMVSGLMLSILLIAGAGIWTLFTGEHIARLGRWTETVVQIVRAGNAPGTDALEAAGCRARLITVAQAMDLVEPFSLGPLFDPRLAGVPYLSCRRRSPEAPFDCASVARRWLAAVNNRPGVLMVAVYPRRGFSPLCRSYFDGAGRHLGGVGPRGVLVPAR